MATVCTLVVTGTSFTIPRTGEPVGARRPEDASGTPNVVGGAFTYQEDFPFTSTDVPHKSGSVQVLVRDDATGAGDVIFVSARPWVK